MIEFLKACFNGPIGFRVFSGLIFLSVIVWVFWGTRISKKNEEDKEQKTEKLDEVTNKTLNNTEFIKQILLAQIGELDKDNRSYLLENYPLGYCLFAINQKEMIIPYNSKLELDYKLDWNSARVIELSNDKLIIKLPNIQGKHDGNTIMGFTSEHLRQVGSKRTEMTLKDMKIVTEVIANNKNSTIVVLGFLNANQ